LRHGRDPGQTATTKKLQENSLELVIRMMRGQQDLAGSKMGFEQRVARRARRGFEGLSATAGDLRSKNPQRHLQLASQAAAVGAPQPGVGMQTVIDVDRAQARASALRRR